MGYGDYNVFMKKIIRGEAGSTKAVFCRERRFSGKISACFKILKGFTNVDASKLFSIDNLPHERRSGVKLEAKKYKQTAPNFS